MKSAKTKRKVSPKLLADSPRTKRTADARKGPTGHAGQMSLPNLIKPSVHFDSSLGFFDQARSSAVKICSQEYLNYQQSTHQRGSRLSQSKQSESVQTANFQVLTAANSNAGLGKHVTDPDIETDRRDRKLLHELNGGSGDQRERRTPQLDLAQPGILSRTSDEREVGDMHIMINRDSGRESGAAMQSKSDTQALQDLNMQMSSTLREKSGTAGQGSLNNAVSDLSHLRSHQRHSSMKASQTQTSNEDSFSGYVETSTDRDYNQTTKRRSSMSPTAQQDFVKKAFMAQKTQELKLQSQSLRHGLNLKQKIKEMRQIQSKTRSIAKHGQNVDIKDLINDKAKDMPIGAVDRPEPVRRRSSSSNSSKEEIILFPEKIAALKRTQHCFQKDGEAYKGLLYVQQLTDSNTDLQSSQRFLEDTAGALSSSNLAPLSFEQMYQADKPQDLAMIPKNEAKLSLNRSLKKREEGSKGRAASSSQERRDLDEVAQAQGLEKEKIESRAREKRADAEYIDLSQQSNPYQSMRGENSEKSMTIIHEEDLEETIQHNAGSAAARTPVDEESKQAFSSIEMKERIKQSAKDQQRPEPAVRHEPRLTSSRRSEKSAFMPTELQEPRISVPEEDELVILKQDFNEDFEEEHQRQSRNSSSHQLHHIERKDEAPVLPQELDRFVSASALTHQESFHSNINRLDVDHENPQALQDTQANRAEEMDEEAQNNIDALLASQGRNKSEHIMNEESKEIQEILQEEEFQLQNYEVKQQKEESGPILIESKGEGLATFLIYAENTGNTNNMNIGEQTQTQSNLYQITSYENSTQAAPASDTLNFSLKPPTAAQLEDTQETNVEAKPKHEREKEKQLEEVHEESVEVAEPQEPQTSIQKLLQKHNLKFQQDLIRSAMEPPRRHQQQESQSLMLLSSNGGSYFLQNQSELLQEHKKNLIDLRNKFQSVNDEGQQDLWQSGIDGRAQPKNGKGEAQAEDLDEAQTIESSMHLMNRNGLVNKESKIAEGPRHATVESGAEMAEDAMKDSKQKSQRSFKKPQSSRRKKEPSQKEKRSSRKPESKDQIQDEETQNASSVYQLLNGTEYFNHRGSYDPLNFIRTHGLEETLRTLTKTLQTHKASSKRSKSQSNRHSARKASAHAPPSSELSLSSSSRTDTKALEESLYWPLIAHKLAQSLKTAETSLKSSKDKVKSLQSLSQQTLQATVQKYESMVGMKDAEILNLKEQQRILARQHEERLEEFRHRISATEKNVYLKVESEYAEILQEKDLMLRDQAERIEQVQELVRDTGRRIEEERRRMQEAHESAREKDRADVVRIKKQYKAEAAEEVAKEIKKMKEIVGQEYEFKLKHLEESFLKKNRKIEEDALIEREEFIKNKEEELKAVIANERAKLQAEKVRSHAQATQELYDEINRTLHQKYMTETKAKLNAISQKLKQNFDEKIRELDAQKEAADQREKQIINKSQLKQSQLNEEISELKKKIGHLEEKEKDAVAKQDLSFQLANNLQPKTGADGNCKRCEALIFANGLYIEKIKKLKRSLPERPVSMTGGAGGRGGSMRKSSKSSRA